jgi:ubiquitin C-terminal hydrolase
MYNATFADRGQHDANEFLVTLLDALDEDLNQAPAARNPGLNYSQLTGVELGNMFHQSIISSLFHSQTASITVYECGHRQRVVEQFSCWSLPLNGKQRMTLDDCVAKWRGPHQLLGDDGQWCEQCQRIIGCKIETVVERLAPVLVVHLKRFHVNMHHISKNNAPVSFPRKFDSTTYASTDTGQYELTAVICHAGGLHSGHYTCTVRDPENIEQWFFISDESVAPTNITAVMGGLETSGIVLLYESRQGVPALGEIE